MKKITLVILLSLSISLSLLSSNLIASDGNLLLKVCQNALHYIDTNEMRSAMDFGFCMGLIQGVKNTMSYVSFSLSENEKICFPDGLTNVQAARIVVKFLNDNPEILHEEQTFLTLIAFDKAYGCD